MLAQTQENGKSCPQKRRVSSERLYCHRWVGKLPTHKTGKWRQEHLPSHSWAEGLQPVIPLLTQGFLLVLNW